MTDADDMIYVAQSEFKQLVGKNTGSICEAKQTMICEDSSQAHGTGM